MNVNDKLAIRMRNEMTSGWMWMNVNKYEFKLHSVEWMQGRHLRGLVAPPPPKEKEKRKKKEKKEKKEKRKEKKERKKEGNYEWRQITTYKVLFFPIFQ